MRLGVIKALDRIGSFRGQSQFLKRPREARLLLIALAVLALAAYPALASGDGGSEPIPTVNLDETSAGVELTNPQVATELPHTNLDRAEVVDLLEGVFEPVLEGAAGPFDDLSPEKLISEHAAIVEADLRPEPTGITVGADQETLQGESPQGKVLLESTLPLSQNNEVVDLSLEKAGASYESVNPLVAVQIPQEIGEGINLPSAQVEFDLKGAPEDRAPWLSDSTAIYPNVAPDTDLVVAPTPTGFETFTTFRSQDAPTSQSFEVKLPAGGELRAVKDGAAVFSDGEKRLEIHSPSAIDASEAEVPVEMTVDEGTITLTIHPQPSSQYPILADPLVESFSWSSGSMSPFETYTTDSTWMVTHCCDQGPDQVGAGMAARALGLSYSPESDDHWLYYVPRYHQGVQEGHIPTSFIAGFTLSNVFTKGSSGPSSPYMYAGVWDPALGSWAGKAPYQAIWAREGSLPNVIGGTISFTTGNDKQAQEAVGPGIHTNENASIGGPREMIAGGATVEFGDEEPPEVIQPSSSSTWANQTAQAPISVTVTDTGLGAKRAEFPLPGQEAKKVTNPCVGTVGYPCPSQWRANLGTGEYNPAAMPQGWLSIPVWGEDVIGNKSVRPVLAEVGIDHTNPSLSALTGTATEQATVGTHKLEYGLKFSATDGFEARPTVQKTLTAELSHPFGVAVDNGGTVWVVDREHNQLKRFNQAGEYLGSVATKGSGNGQLLEPQMIAIDKSGNIWVTDLGNHRLEEFSPSGAYVRQFKDASLETPYGIAIAPDGSIWVSNTGTNEVVKITEASGTLSIAKRVKGERKIELGPPLSIRDTTFSKPTGLASDSSGNIWVADRDHNRVQEINASGEIIRQIGSFGSAPGQFNAPYGVAVTGLGHLLVADSENNRIQMLDTSGDFLRFISDGSTQMGSPKGIAVGPGNTAFVADWNNNRVLRWGNVDLDSQSGVVKSEVLVDGIPREVFKPGCSGEAVCAIISHEWALKAKEFADGAHTLQVVVTDGVGLKSSSAEVKFELHPDRTAPQLTLSGSITEQAMLGSTRPSYKLNLQGVDPEPKEGSLVFSSSVNSGNGATFSAPADVAMDGKGNYWVLDKGNNRLVKYGPADTYLLRAGSSGSAGGQVSGASGIAVDSSGNVWVADSANNRIDEFTESGVFVLAFGKDVNKTKVEASGTEAERNVCTAASGNLCQAATAGSAAGQLKGPKGLALTSSGTIWVADTGNSRLEKFNTSGGFISALASEGSEPGKLKEPTAVALASDGSKWVADTGNNRIEQWNINNSFVRAVGKEGSGSGEFKSPKAVEVDPNGNVWVADLGNSRVKEFDSTGQFLVGYGTQQPTGDLNSFAPVGLGLDGQGGLYVADSNNNRVQHWVPSSSSQSGVVSSTIKVDGKVVDSYNPGCSTEKCTLSHEWTLKSDSYSAGNHLVEATVTDGSGLSTTKSITVTIARDATTPAVSLSGPLAEAPKGWMVEGTHSITASATDENGYGVKQIRLLIDGKVAQESLTQTCEEGGCTKSKTFWVDTTQLEGGAHEAAVIVEDGAGNWKKASWTMNVDPQGPVKAEEASATLEAMEETVPPAEAFEPVASTQEFLEQQVIEAGDSPHLSWEEGSIVSSGVTVNTEFDPSSDQLTMEGTEGAIELTPATNLAAPEVVENVAAVLPSSGEAVDTVVRPEYNGAFMFTTIRAENAPEEYEWRIHLTNGQYLVQHDEQHIQVMSKTGAEAWLISANSARDATGAAVPTSIAIVEGSNFVLKVHHRGSGFVYPISAGQSYETGYATVTATLVEEATGEEEEVEEVEDDEIGPEPDGLEPWPSGTILTEAQANYVVGHSPYARPAVVPPPKPISSGKIENQIYRSQCGPACSKWNAKVYNATYFTLVGDGNSTPLFTTWWEGGSEVHATVSQNWKWEPFIWRTTWNCGAIGASKVLWGSNEHLTAYAHFTIESWFGASKYPKEKNFTLFAWVYPNGFQTKHVNWNWSGQPADHTCPRVAATY